MTLRWVSGKVVLKKESVAADPYYNNVSLLLHGDGTNGSTTIVDSSPSPKTVTAVGDAQISTAQSKFGGASIAFDGTGDYLTIPGTSFDLPGDFTIEAFFLLNNARSEDETIVGKWDDPLLRSWLLNVRASSVIFALGQSGAIDAFQPSATIASNTWYHIAVSRAGSSIKIFLNGSQIGTTYTSSYNCTSSAQDLAIGINLDADRTPLDGYIDDLRITKGVARYTSNFTPPTAPFPEVLG